MKRDSMVVYREWKEALSDLSSEERCVAWEAIMDYAFDGKTPEDKFVKVVTAMMRARIDKDQSHYEDTCNKRAEAGRLGGLKKAENRSKGKQTVANLPNATNATHYLANGSKGKQTVANLADNDNDNDYVYNSFINEADIYARARTREECIKVYIQNHRQSVEAFCMNNSISIDRFEKLSKEVLVEWEMEGWKPRDKQDAKSRLINHIRVKINRERSNGITRQDKFQQRRGSDPSTWTEEDFNESF